MPRFGKDYAVPIIKGFDEDTLAKGIAWYPEGAGPGQVGNYVLAAHRITHGEPFSKFPACASGDLVASRPAPRRTPTGCASSGTSTVVDFQHRLAALPGAGRPEPAGRRPTTPRSPC